MKKILLGVTAVLLLAVSGLLTYVKAALPNVGPAPDIKVEVTPERVARGSYLANSVLVCMDCHSGRDWTKFSGPIADGTLGKGGEIFDQKFGFPGVYYSRNITPAGIKDWTDGELFRLITTGVRRDGRAIFPVMPYPYYGKMDAEDIKDIIAYLRTLEPIASEIPESKSDFPMNFIINTIPKPAALVTRPPASDSVAYGAYLTNAAACIECHTKVEKGQIIPDLAFSGGREFPFPNGDVIRTPNLTPDNDTGIGSMTKEAFVDMFRKKAEAGKKAPTSFQTMMPWTMYGGMTSKDLGAIYDYLRTVKPIKNQVERFTPAAK
jgi:mono/diheme cytochrome c family protein